jgi:hypothetical protein
MKKLKTQKDVEFIISEKDITFLNGKKIGIHRKKGNIIHAIINWSKIPEGLDWLTQDKSGMWYAYRHKPTIHSTCWSCNGIGSPSDSESIDSTLILLAPEDWVECLFKRPEEI